MKQGKEQKKLMDSEFLQSEPMSLGDLGMAETNEEELTGEETESEELTQTKAEQQPTAKKQPKTNRKSVVIPQIKDVVTVKIEKIMEEDLKDMFATLSPIAQQEFKIKGEETAFKIRELLKSSHVKVKNIFELIISWLKILPGVNKFFLEQEAKIKTDKIFLLSKKSE